MKYIWLGFITVLSILMPHPAQSGQPLSYYLSENTTYNPAIPTPEAFFGTQTGEWHLRHDQIVAYLHGCTCSAAGH